jgi:rubrerythrin
MLARQNLCATRALLAWHTGTSWTRGTRNTCRSADQQLAGGDARLPHLQRALAQATDPQQCRSLHSLALAEQHHADLWASRLTALGEPVPEYNGRESGEADSLSNRIGGLDLALRRLELDESRDIARYGKQIEDLGDEATIAILKEVLEDERDHYITLGNLIRHHLPPTQLDPEQAKQALDDLVAARDKGQPRPPVGSATPSTESTTASAPSSASSPASPGPPKPAPTLTTSSSPDSPA